MNKIKFSNFYKKLGFVYNPQVSSKGNYPLPDKGNYILLTFFREASITWLIGVSRCKLEDLPLEFICYDTRYYQYNKGTPPLKCGYQKIFPTLRRYTPNKYKYYVSMIGQEFKIVYTI